MSLPTTTDDDFATDVLASRLPVLVEFTAAWCPPCHAIAPVLENIAAENQGRLRVLALDVDTDPRTSARYGVLGMPTLSLFVGGQVVSQVTGARPKSAILRQIEPFLAPAAV
jgi:thioredoxin 1